jgi:adenine-specific DNA-methyltransferase
MTDYQAKFQLLLRELFQFDCADLDFGIYRIMNYKRDVIEKFITKDLPKAIAEELDRGALAEQSQAQGALAIARQKVLDALGEEALDVNDKLIEKYRETKAGKEYLEAQAKAKGSRAQEALEAAIYNHLYAFFSRYWQDGDFISKRRYSKKERYAIPYNGEEVTLYWANHDQYYIKTGEHFTDYSYKAPNGVTVHFKLQQVDVEQDNVKGDKRFFLAKLKEIVWDEVARKLVIPFEYRPLTEQEAIIYGQKNQQEAINGRAVIEIPKRVKTPDALTALAAERCKTAEGTAVSYLEHHLRQYTRRNTSDFFIHRDLKGFLSRELDFYLKNEALNLEEMEAAGEKLSESWFQLMRLIKRVGNHIIEFLAQIEDFQKMLWEKRKFVTETFYCITVSNIPQTFYPEIAACETQWVEWKDLFHINKEQSDLFTSNKKKKEKRTAFLVTHPTLVLDTRHFDRDFTDRLLASFTELDEMTDGLLIHSENFQALNLLLEKHGRKIKCVHIDPPYNTQTSGFLYKNDYQHSSWLAMMNNRIVAAVRLLSRDGAFLCHIDENEYEVLHILFANIGIPDAGTIVWDKKNPMLGRRRIATQHEYILWRTWNEASVYLRPTNIRIILDKAESLIHDHGGVNEQVRREFSDWISSYVGLSGGERAYNLINDDGRVFQSVAMGAPEPRTDQKFFIPLIHPVTKKSCPVPTNGWSRAPKTLQKLIEKNEIIFGEDERVQPRKKVFLKPDSGRQVSSVISDSGRGKNDVEKMGLEFPYCHPVSLYVELLGAAAAESDDIVLDHFAGSGTTGQAIINLNREEGGTRKFILAEVDKCFEVILLPRIKKVTFTPEWKDGMPERLATQDEAERSPRIVKVIRLESYEDALNNLSFDESSDQQALQFEDYLLRYMLKWETRKSETLLDVEKLSKPFSYQLHIHRDGETRTQPVDLPETFNYLIGMEVETRQAYSDDRRRYLAYRGTTHEGRKVAVIWRETDGWQKDDYERDRAFVAEHNLTEGADEVFVNGDSYIPDARSLDRVFKERMFTPVET